MGVMMWAERSPATYSPHGRGTGFGRSCELLAPTEGTFSEMGSVCRSAQHDPEQHDSRHGKGLLHTHLAARSSYPIDWTDAISNWPQTQRHGTVL